MTIVLPTTIALKLDRELPYLWLDIQVYQILDSVCENILYRPSLNLYPQIYPQIHSINRSSEGIAYKADMVISEHIKLHMTKIRHTMVNIAKQC